MTRKEWADLRALIRRETRKQTKELKDYFDEALRSESQLHILREMTRDNPSPPLS